MKSEMKNETLNNILYDMREIFRFMLELELNKLSQKYNVDLKIELNGTGYGREYLEIRIGDNTIYLLVLKGNSLFNPNTQNEYYNEYKELYESLDKIEDKIKVYLYDKEREIK